MNKSFLLLLFLLTFVSTTAHLQADMFLTLGDAQFNFDTDNSGDTELSIDGVNGLADFGVWLGYNRSGTSFTRQRLMPIAESSSDGTIQFEQVEIRDETPLLIDVSLTLSLTEVSATHARLDHTLTIEKSGFVGTGASLDTFIGFDFAGSGSDVATAPAAGTDFLIEQTGVKQLYGNLTSPVFDGKDVYDNGTGNPDLDNDRFDITDDFVGSGGDLAFGGYVSYGLQTDDSTLTQTGVIGVEIPEVDAVPEPSSISLVALVFTLACTRRRRGKRA